MIISTNTLTEKLNELHKIEIDKLKEYLKPSYSKLKQRGITYHIGIIPKSNIEDKKLLINDSNYLNNLSNFSIKLFSTINEFHFLFDLDKGIDISIIDDQIDWVFNNTVVIPKKYR